MAKVLDRSKDFGEIFGGVGGRYVQGDVIFDAGGNEIVESEKQTFGAALPGKNGKKGNDAVALETVAESGQASLLDEQLAAQAGVTES